MNNNLEQSTLGGGCFWCTEAVFQKLKGVESVVPGYSGGNANTADYHQVCSGRTDHAECVQVNFDPDVIDFETVLKVHLSTHNPTTLNRQGADTGPQYRSAIFYHDEAQRETAQVVITEFEAILKTPVVTSLERFTAFYEAEAEHQNYFQTHPLSGYCQAVIVPKMAHFRAQWEAYLKA